MSALRTLAYRLVYTSEGHLDLSWPFCGGLIGLVAACVVGELTGHAVSAVAWGTLGGMFTATLTAAIPIGKARILARSALSAALPEAADETGRGPDAPGTDWTPDDAH